MKCASDHMQMSAMRPPCKYPFAMFIHQMPAGALGVPYAVAFGFCLLACMLGLTVGLVSGVFVRSAKIRPVVNQPESHMMSGPVVLHGWDKYRA